MPRPGARARGYDGKWDRERKAYLAIHRTCTRCGAPATIVNHKTPHRGDRSLFWRRSNWEAVCQPCHDGPIQQQERHGYHSGVGADGLPTDPAHPFNR
jgi:5-methylcytosine-specific restriction endonuclease McrA